MEWMLQVVDELDDVVGALRHRSSGFLAETRTVLLTALSLGGLGISLASGAEPAVIAAAATVFACAAWLKLHTPR